MNQTLISDDLANLAQELHSRLSKLPSVIQRYVGIFSVSDGKHLFEIKDGKFIQKHSKSWVFFHDGYLRPLKYNLEFTREWLTEKLKTSDSCLCIKVLAANPDVKSISVKPGEAARTLSDLFKEFDIVTFAFANGVGGVDQHFIGFDTSQPMFRENFAKLLAYLDSSPQIPVYGQIETDPVLSELDRGIRQVLDRALSTVATQTDGLSRADTILKCAENTLRKIKAEKIDSGHAHRARQPMDSSLQRVP